MRINNFFSHATFVLFLLSFESCSRKSSPSRGTPDSDGVLANPLVGALNIRVDPFAAEGVPNVVVEADASVGTVYFRAPVTIPGVHWAWTQSLPSTLEVSSGGKWISSSISVGDALPAPPFRIRFVANMNASASRGWPAVGGLVGTLSGTTVMPSFAFVLPENLSVPLRVNFESQGAPLFLDAPATSCGVGCLDFGNWADAIEVPISFVASEAARFRVGSVGDLPIDVTVAEGVSADPVHLRTAVEGARTKLSAIWDALSVRWGTIAAGRNFRFPLIVVGQCQSQGLEHDAAALLALGWCGGTSFQNDLTQLGTHEMIHAWNGRHIFPSETAIWEPFGFDSSRLEQLYFYEGFTEGMARIAVAENVSALRSSLVTKWNQSVASIATSHLGAGLASISREDPMGAYQVGGFLALWLAAKARSQHGLDDGKSRFWNIMSALKTGNSGVAFDVASPLWKRKCVTNRTFAPCSQTASGYSHEDLLQAMNTALSLSDWNSFVQNHLGSVFLADRSALDAAVVEIAAAAGVGTVLSEGHPIFSVAAGADVIVWPF